jgi:hypothetical protein
VNFGANGLQVRQPGVISVCWGFTEYNARSVFSGWTASILQNYNGRSQRYSLIYKEVLYIILGQETLLDELVQQYRGVVELVHLRRPTRVGLIVHLELPLPTTDFTRLSARKIDNSSAVRWDLDFDY